MCNIVILGKWGKNKYACIRRQRQIRHKSQTLVVSLNGDWGGLVGHMMDGITLHTYWLQCTTWSRDTGQVPNYRYYEEPHFANIHTAMMIFATTWSYRPAMSSTTSVAFLTITGKIYSISIYIDTWQLMSIFHFSTGSHGSSERRNLSFFVDSF